MEAALFGSRFVFSIGELVAENKNRRALLAPTLQKGLRRLEGHLVSASEHDVQVPVAIQVRCVHGQPAPAETFGNGVWGEFHPALVLKKDKAFLGRLFVVGEK